MKETDQKRFFELAQCFFNENPLKEYANEFKQRFQQSINIPYIDISVHEEETQFIVKAKVPGIKKDQIHFDLHERYLTITVTHSEKTEVQQPNIKTASHTHENLSKTILLPYEPDRNQLASSIKDESLIISLAKK